MSSEAKDISRKDLYTPPKLIIGKTIGKNGEEEKDFEISILDCPHLIFFGSCGNGKTVLAKTVVSKFIKAYNPIINFFDAKGSPGWIHFAEKYSQFPLGVPVENNPNLSKAHELYFLINEAYEELMKRKILLDEAKVENFVDYNNTNNSNLVPHLTLIEDWVFLNSTILGEGNLFLPLPSSPHEKLKTILREGRKYGIMLMFISQGVKDDNIPNFIKYHCRVKVLGRSDQQSANYLGIEENISTLQFGEFFLKADNMTYKIRNKKYPQDNLEKEIDSNEAYKIEKKPYIYPETPNYLTYQSLNMNTHRSKKPNLSNLQAVKRFLRRFSK